MTGVMILSFLNTIYAPCSIVLVIASAFLLLSMECRLTKVSSFFFSFLFFLAVAGVDVNGVTGRSFDGYIHSVRNGGLRGHRWSRLVLGVLTYLLTRFLVLVSIGFFKL